ncbi:unnamed protein product [Lupinus luteus]|uniref:Uncharacterized protein n=1 Tax=Lupinus luteus TaxID=3873 RepID=A0AAV1WN78_LUPLU
MEVNAILKFFGSELEEENALPPDEESMKESEFADLNLLCPVVEITRNMIREACMP